MLGIAAHAPAGWKAGTGRDSKPQNLRKQNEEGPFFKTRKTKRNSNKRSETVKMETASIHAIHWNLLNKMILACSVKHVPREKGHYRAILNF